MNLLIKHVIHKLPYLLPTMGLIKALQREGVKPSALLGYSLGEYDVIMTSGTLGFEEALVLVEKRAKLLWRSVERDILAACMP